MEHNQQATELSGLIESLNRMNVADADWEAEFDDLVTLVKEHVSQEESEIFPAGQKEFGGQTDALREEYLRKKTAFLDQV